MLVRQIRHQAGDTIVEVMVVLAILGLAIGISYATANRSLLNTRQAEENSQATELVQSQLEQLRAASANSYIYTSHPFCFSAAGQYTPLPSLLCNIGEANRYGVSISWGGGTSNDTFTIVAKWLDLLGRGNDTVTLVYRVHLPS